MSKACMCLSHGNATPERGFSENKAVLTHREKLDEETIVAIRITKDFLNIEHWTFTFEISRHARQKYGEFP